STTFLAVLLCVAATFAFRSKTKKQSLVWWAGTGLIGGVAVLFRPDSGLFVAAVGLTLVLTTIFASRQLSQGGIVPRFSRAFFLGVVLSVGFCLVLAPWTIRNWRLFHVFQPLAPPNAEMPGEFVPRGYLAWCRTWLTEEQDVDTFLWSLDTLPIKVDDAPPS